MDSRLFPLANLIGYHKLCFPYKHLVLAFGANPRSPSLWILIIENFEKKRVSFSEEGMKDYLLFGEKVVLSKLTLENLPIYYSVIPHKFSKSVMQTLGRTSHAHSPNFGPLRKGLSCWHHTSKANEKAYFPLNTSIY